MAERSASDRTAGRDRPRGRGRNAPQPVRPVELRVLDGPNLYFPRPAVKLTLEVAGWLDLAAERVERAAVRLGVRPDGAGRPGSQQRRRWVTRLAAHLTRGLAERAGTSLAVRARPGPEPTEIVVAYPWRRRGAAEAFGREVAGVLDGALRTRRGLPRLLAEAAARLEGAEPGPAPSVPDPDVPVIAVTGTNGKTTTVRLLAHLCATAGRTVAYSSTDGVYVNGRLVEAGDYSGFGGAARALSQPGIDVAVLETARGGILLRGIGTMRNEVAVVTNVTADHLGLLGIETLDQLAEVKATITRITRPSGWDVLNADDPRVLAMRRGIGGRPWLFSTDPDHPALRTALSEGGRGMTVVDGHLTVLLPGASRALVALEDVPVTLAGISGHNVSNAMGAAAAALGIGLDEDAVAEGLRTFVLDPQTNPGRANVFELDERVVVVDYAHNEGGMRGLVEVARGLRRPGADVWVALCAAGDRTDEVLHGFGYLAARGADHVVVAELRRYLRGRDGDDLLRRLVAGVRDGGVSEVPIAGDEVQALAFAFERSAPGDVLAVTALGMRDEVFAALDERGAVPLGPERVRELVRAARAGPDHAATGHAARSAGAREPRAGEGRRSARR